MFFAASVAFGLAIAAVDPAPTVDQLIARALAQAPSLAVLDARLSAVEARIGAADAPADPMIELALQDAGFPRWTVGREEMSMVGLEWKQTWLDGRRRQAQRAVATADRDRADADRRWQRAALAREIRRRYAAVYTLDEERQTVEAARELLDLLGATLRGRYAAGEIDQAALLRLQLEAQRLEERATDLAAERQALVIELNTLAGMAPDEPLGLVSALPATEWPAEQDRPPAHAAALQVATREIELAQAELAVAESELRPKWSTRAMAASRGRLDPVVTLAVGLEWPRWRARKQAQQRLAAERSVAAARADLTATTIELRGRLALAHAQWERAQTQLLRYREGLIPLSTETLNASRVRYLSGEGSFEALIDDWRAWWMVRADAARRSAAAFEAWADAQALLEEGR